MNFNIQHISFLCLVFSTLYCAGTAAQIPDEQKDHIVIEINERLIRYSRSVVSKDINEILAFWSSEDDFTHAADGEIVGGYSEWSQFLIQDNATTDRWAHFDYDNIRVAVLAENAATATVEFDFEKIDTNGVILGAHGSWTYVFKKYGNTWKVIQSNGHHIFR